MGAAASPLSSTVAPVLKIVNILHEQFARAEIDIAALKTTTARRLFILGCQTVNLKSDDAVDALNKLAEVDELLATAERALDKAMLKVREVCDHHHTTPGRDW